MKIVIISKEDDYHIAHLENRPDTAVTGRTQDQAIMTLIRNRQEDLGIQIEYMPEVVTS